MRTDPLIPSTILTRSAAWSRTGMKSMTRTRPSSVSHSVSRISESVR